MASSTIAEPHSHTHAQDEDPDDLIPTAVPSYKTNFLQACLSAQVLTFGTFTLKSGRVSPYFFNAGLFHRASLLGALSTAFAQTLLTHSSIDPTFKFDILFGPAYKGIPLATATIDKLASLSPQAYSEVSYSFNRKEIKDHGEGGVIVGASLKGKRVVIIDDVITAGTAMREAIGIINAQGGILVGVVVAVDRMERVRDDLTQTTSAIGEVKREFGVPVLSIIDLNDLIGLLGTLGNEEDRERVEEYKERYGASE
ncbi:hypothetical protein JMJ35_006305 [Cladonia borealis]|uniref:Orotate phosphoribosyltransferase n=1 Tax=Cladonia borealis TaxID=184061 RepID=A0AA39QYS3_9LECA|nr:hypothetical protein JMJ35_006305 [Cladonia borealis]